jgi:hypothetical protein
MYDLKRVQAFFIVSLVARTLLGSKVILCRSAILDFISLGGVWLPLLKFSLGHIKRLTFK